MACGDPHLIRVLSQNPATCGRSKKKNAHLRASSGEHFIFFAKRPDGRLDFDQQVTAGGFEPPTLRAEI